VFAVRYKLGFYIPEDDILDSHCRENLKSYKKVAVCERISRCYSAAGYVNHVATF
jgi:hypothetical protein